MNIFETSKRRMTLMDAFDLDPDKVAEQHRIGKAEGIPASFVDDDMRRLHRLDQTEHKLQGLTVLPRTISADPNVAAMAKDDLDRLAAIENISKFKRQQKERDAEARRRANEPGLLHEAASSAWSGLRSVFNNIDIVQADAAQTTLGAMEAGEGKALQYHRQGMPDLLNPNFGANPYELNNPLAGAYDPEDLYQKKHAAITQARDQNIAEYEEDLDAIRPTRSRQTQKELEEYSKQAGLGSSLAYLFTHPRVMTNLTAESGGAMLPAIAAATASGGVGGAPAFAAAFGAGSGYQEYSGTLADRIEASSAQTQKSRADILADRELMEAIRHEARTRGVVIGAVDTATFGLTGLAYNAFKNRVARWAAGTAVQAGGGAAGEAGAQLATHGEITDWPSVAAEMALEVVMGAPEVAAHARFAYNQLRSEQEQDITNLTAMTDAARESKLHQRAPDVFRGLAEQIEENADIQHYYVDGNALHQSGLVAALEEALPDRVGEIRQALATGGTVQIPAADILTKIAPDKGLEDAIKPHLRTADGLSLHELESTGQAELEGDIARNVERAEQAAAQQTETDAIRDDFAAQITATGRMTRDAALQNAALPAAFYQNIAQRLGISVSEAYDKYKLNVVGEPLVGLNQAMPDVAALINGAKEKIRNFVQGWRNKQGGKPFVDYLEVNEEAVQEASQHGLDIAGYRHVISDEAVNHIISRHSDQKVETTRAQIALTDADLETIADVVSTPDRRVYGMKTKDGLDIIASIKRMPDGTLSLVEEVRTGRRKLAVKTLRKHVAATDFNRITQVLLSNARSDGNHANIHVVDIDRNHTPAANNGQDTLNQNANAGSKRGAFDPDTNTIALLEKADLSTFIHELGHFYFETLTRIANELRARDDAAGGGTLTEGEIRLLKDADTLLGKAELTLDDWNQMTLKERRGHHENIAKQFEAYLMTGKAPDVELQGIFSRARAWLFAVYRNWRGLGVTLDDDVRQVFDRLLASDEAIQLAEQNRSMGALFATPEAAGMTAEQFADYQRQFQGASDAALDEMSLRMLADAKAIARLKHKALKAKDKEAKILRGETEIEARRAIMAQPVYRVWQMLTGKMNADTTIASNKRPWTDDVAPEHDDLFTAIAKLGGINRSDIESTWGFDPADKISPVKPGFFVLRREGGQSLDGMRQALVQYGYLTESDSLNDFYEVFEAQRRGDTQYSNRHQPDPGVGKTGEHAHLHDLPAFRLDYASLAEMGYDDAQIATLGRKVKKKGGIHPDLLAELVMDADGNPVYDSGDALVQALLAAPEPKTAVRELTDRIMLERHGELATPEAIGEAADMAAHNDLRLRVLATEYNALAQASGGARLVQSAARQLAAQAIGQKRIRDLSPAQYTRMETRAAKAAQAAMKKGDIAIAAAEKRNQVLQASLARAAHEAKVETKKHALYLRRMNKLDPKTVAIEEREQIEALLERYNLRDQSGKALDRRQSLSEWVQAQREQGIEPDIAPEMLDELKRQPWQNLTVEEFRGLVDTIRQIEHRGKEKNRLLLEQKQQDLNIAKEEISESVKAAGNGKIVDNSTPATWLGQRMAALRRFGWMHTKASTVFYILDGGQRNGPMWRYFGKLANERANFEAAERARLSEALMKISAPLFKRKGLYKRSIRSDIPDRNGQPRVFTPMQVFTVALNMGNAGNLQRLLDGNHWTRDQVERLTANLTGDEWRAVQDIWNLFESMKEQVAAKERRVNGIEPQWVEAVPLTVTSIDGETLHLRGGYYPVKYDAGQSQQAEQFQDAEAGQVITNAAFTSATTRRSYTKARAAAVKDRPLLLDISVMYDGLNEIVHDLAWHEFLIDANRLIRSHRVDSAIRDYHGAEYVRLIKDWLQDIAAGDKIPSTYGARMVAAIRQNVSFAGLAFNVVSALKQLSGLPNSIVRVGAPDILAATLQYMRRGRAMTREAVAASAVMENRARTRFRELNEVRNSLRRQGRVKQQLYRWGYAPLLFFQQQVDVITWHGEYNKQLAAGMSEADAVALADQAVLDAQGGGELKDLSAIERDPTGKIFTVFYSYMNTVLNLGIVTVKGRASIGRKAASLLTLFTVPAIIDTLLGAMLTLGDDDDDETLGQKLVEGQIGYLMGLTVLTREASGAAKALFGVDKGSYKGPTAFRFFDDLHKAAKQIGQGEMDEAMLTSIINLSGDFGLPSAQINRSIKGIKALEEGKTDNPLAVALGYKEKR